MMMSNLNISSILIMMLIILIINLLTTKTSMMCLNLILYTTLMSLYMSMTIKLSPMPFIMFLTIIGGLMIIFLYLTATLWMKKETLTLMTKIFMLSAFTLPMPKIMMNLKMNQMNPEFSMFKNNFNKLVILLIIFLTMMLVFTIEIHMKANMPFRRNLKIWGEKKDF